MIAVFAVRFFTSAHGKDKFFPQHLIQIFHGFHLGRLGRVVKNGTRSLCRAPSLGARQ
jgi:hypothetical protein